MLLQWILIYYLADKFDFDSAILTKALKKIFENRGHTFTVGQSEQVIDFGGNEKDMAKIMQIIEKETRERTITHKL